MPWTRRRGAGHDRDVVRVGEGRHRGLRCHASRPRQPADRRQDAVGEAPVEVGGVETVDADDDERPHRFPIAAAVEFDSVGHRHFFPLPSAFAGRGRHGSVPALRDTLSPRTAGHPEPASTSPGPLCSRIRGAARCRCRPPSATEFGVPGLQFVRQPAAGLGDDLSRVMISAFRRRIAAARSDTHQLEQAELARW